MFVKMEQLTKKFGEFTAVNNLTLTAERGEVSALLGPNGAGKTTTIKMMMGLLSPCHGTLTINDIDCFTQRHEVMKLIGYVPDEPTFYDYLTGRELLNFVGDMHGLSREETKASYQPVIEKMSLDNDLDEYAMNYSKGMKKKLAIAMALIHTPALLILDEPTNGLDPHSTREIHELIRSCAANGACVLLTTHLLDQAEKLSDKVHIIHQGELKLSGKTETLKARPDQTLEELFFQTTRGDAGDEP